MTTRWRWRVGLFGGSFNPPHLGHQALILRALETVPMNELLVAPAFSHPEKDDLAPFADRMNMTDLMLRKLNDDRLKLSEIERYAYEAGGKGLTCNTVQFIIDNSLNYKVMLIVGADVVQAMPGWDGWDKLLDLIHQDRLELVPMPRNDGISSSMTRAIYAGHVHGSRPEVPQLVHRYILDKGLYLAV